MKFIDLTGIWIALSFQNVCACGPTRVSEAGHGDPPSPGPLPRLLGVEAAAVPVVAGLQVLRLADAPAQPARVPEQHAVPSNFLFLLREECNVKYSIIWPLEIVKKQFKYRFAYL